MRYEIRDISPPTGVRAAMELQVKRQSDTQKRFLPAQWQRADTKYK